MPSTPRRRIPPIPTWTRPHHGFVHRPADLLRIDWDNVQCKGCGKTFRSVADGYRKDEEGGPG